MNLQQKFLYSSAVGPEGVRVYFETKASQGCLLRSVTLGVREGAVASRQYSQMFCLCLQRHSTCRRRHIVSKLWVSIGGEEGGCQVN